MIYLGNYGCMPCYVKYDGPMNPTEDVIMLATTGNSLAYSPVPPHLLLNNYIKLGLLCSY